MAFVTSFPFLSILVTFFANGTAKVVYFFSVFSPKQVNCPVNSSINLFF